MEKIMFMRDLMYKVAHYNWTFCYARSNSRTEDTFQMDFPIAFEKIINGETNICKKDMIKRRVCIN